MKRSILSHLLFPVVGFSAVDSSFDPAAFAAGAFEGKGDTRRIQLPEKEYAGFVVGPFGEDGKTRIRVEKGYVILDVVWQLDDPEVKQQLGLEKLPLKRQSLFLDVKEGNQLDMGPFKNADLNKLREVFGLNADGQPWKFSDFVGKPARVKLANKPNKDDPENPFQNIVAVTKV